MKIAFVGAGSVSRALAPLFEAAGHAVALGERADLPGILSGSELVVLAVPFAATRELLPGLAEALAGKVVVDATNPVNPDWSPMLLGQESSAGEEVAKFLPGSRVVKAFNTVFADVMRPERLVRGGHRVTCFVASDAEDAARIVAEVATDAGFAPRLVGPLKMARYLEAMAHLNIQIAAGMKGGTNAAFIYDQSVS